MGLAQKSDILGLIPRRVPDARSTRPRTAEVSITADLRTGDLHAPGLATGDRHESIPTGHLYVD